MPARWNIDHARRLVEVVLVGETGPDEVRAFFDEFEQAGAIPYGKLIDAIEAAPKIDNKVMALVAERIANYKSRGPGPVAVVVHGTYFDGLAKLFLLAVDADERARLFKTVAEAREWLDEVALVRTATD